jgi:RNA-directed DNA polymerase
VIKLRDSAKEIEQLSLNPEVLSIIERVNGSYKTFKLPKRKGGERTIAAPLGDLLFIQRVVLRALYGIPVNRCAKAYIPGRNIRDNAKFHVGQKVLMKADVRDFFGSIRIDQVRRSLERGGIDARSSTAIAEVCCFCGSLPQGAPTSGYLSNIVLDRFDRKIFLYCRNRGLRYTRYSDDISISGDKLNPKEVTDVISSELSRIGLELNEQKCRIVHRNRSRQTVTGIVVNEKISPGRHFLSDIRQQVYYIRKFGIAAHAEIRGYSNAKEAIATLRGKIAFARQVLGDVPLVQEWHSLVTGLGLSSG